MTQRCLLTSPSVMQQLWKEKPFLQGSGWAGGHDWAPPFSWAVFSETDQGQSRGSVQKGAGTAGVLVLLQLTLHHTRI